ncbi:MAG: MBL fold metallo-hydrolase [Clostridiales bacterium]|nr:MBL fold metallo-hydrolase [Clostridiales bacterium]
MLVTVLGKYGPYPKANGGTSGYLVQSGGTAVMLDFGSGALGRVQRFLPLEKLDAVVLSHLHNDHMCDMLPLAYALEATKRTLPVYMPAFECPQGAAICAQKELCVHYLQNESTFQIGALTFTCTQMVHPYPSFAVRVSDGMKTLFYSGDTAVCPQLAPAAQGSDLLLLDCGKCEGTNAPHLSLSEAKALVKALDIPALVSHLNPALTYKSTAGLTVVQEGKTYTG